MTADSGTLAGMMSGLARPARLLGVALLSLGLPLVPACADKGGTTGASGSTGDASTGDGGTTTTGATSEPASTGGIATVTSDTHDTSTTQEPACGPNTCGPCPVECTPQDACVDGEWQCECTGCAVTTGGESSGGESTGGGGIVCGGDSPQFPEFDRTCAQDGDCTVVFHQTDCCGTVVAWGLNADAGKPFSEAESECAMMYGICECAPMPTVTDDGKSTEDTTQVTVTCVESMCTSTVP